MNRYTSYVVLVLSISITILTAIQVNAMIVNDAKERLDNQMEDIENRLERRIQAYEQVLFGGKGLFESSQYVTRDEWKTFVGIQMIEERFPGIQGVGFSKLIVGKDNLEIHIEQIRKEGFTDYTVNPEGEREEYHPVVYLEPVNERNKQAFGYDMYSEPGRHNAIDLARDTGLTTVSGKVRLVQEIDDNVQAGFLMYVPLYTKGKPIQTIEQRQTAFEGFVYAPFRMDDFMTHTLENTDYDITLKIYNTDTEPQNIMYDQTKIMNIDESEINHSLSKVVTIDVNQRQWVLEGIALKSINIETEGMIPQVILVIGLILSSMLFFIFRTYGKIITISEQSLQKEKMANIGELAARLAHDIRNPLSSIISWTELIQLHLKEVPNEKIASYTKSILKSTDSIKFQLNTVMDFVRERPTKISKNSIILIIFDAIKITPVPDTVTINMPENDLDVECDKSQMVVVFSNLITNSIQAMDGSGNITINVKAIQNNVIIDFIDSGPGISKENRSKIFEPLFTTKSMGTGLGLVSCKNIIEYHHGKISVKNNPTTFTIEMPIKQ